MDEDCDGFVDESPAADDSCSVANAERVLCAAARCVPVVCEDGFDDCDGEPSNGCEARLGTALHCRSCANMCDEGVDCLGGTCENEAFVHVSAAADHTCAIEAGGRPYCWGHPFSGRLGVEGAERYGRYVNAQSTPLPVTGVAEAVALSASATHTCLVDAEGRVHCWGLNEDGQLGDGTTRQQPIPVEVALAEPATDVATYSEFSGHTCAVLESGGVRCWGDNDEGKLGDGTMERHLRPTSVDGISDAVAVATGQAHSCALHEDGRISCWGSNAAGQLGNGMVEGGSPLPVAVTGIADAIAVGAGRRSTCALSSDGGVRCWGDNEDGQLGDGSITTRPEPVQVEGVSDAIALSVGARHACAVRETGAVVCWGANGDGQLGDRTELERTVPVRVLGIDDAERVAASRGEGFNAHTCALLSNGALACWGSGSFGELGSGSVLDSATPVLVVPPNPDVEPTR